MSKYDSMSVSDLESALDNNLDRVDELNADIKTAPRGDNPNYEADSIDIQVRIDSVLEDMAPLREALNTYRAELKRVRVNPALGNLQAQLERTLAEGKRIAAAIDAAEKARKLARAQRMADAGIKRRGRPAGSVNKAKEEPNTEPNTEPAWVPYYDEFILTCDDDDPGEAFALEWNSDNSPKISGDEVNAYVLSI